VEAGAVTVKRRRPSAGRQAYPAIADYGLISDAHSCALVSRAGSIDWCCMPRMDRSSLFGRLLDWKRGGFCAIAPRRTEARLSRRYIDGTMVLETTFRSNRGSVRLIDCLTMRIGGRDEPEHRLLRVVEGLSGTMAMRLEIVPRFDYGQVRPWLRQIRPGLVAAIGGSDGLVIACDCDLNMGGQHDLSSNFTVRPGERVRLSLRWDRPEKIDHTALEHIEPEELDHKLEQTIAWWERWSSRGRPRGPAPDAQIRSALVLKALTNAPTGAIAAAATTSLPELLGGSRNWDYRYSWIRDSSFSARSLADIGFDREAEGFRRFAQRSAAGNARDLQVMYGLGGERRLTETKLTHLNGYRRSRPVRIGNDASRQLQLDAYGELMLLIWAWHLRGFSPIDEDWRFIVDLVDTACQRWVEPDRGIWEIRGRPLHFTHSKALCWAAIDRGVALAEDCSLRAPLAHWRRVMRDIRQAIEARGYDPRRGVFLQAFGRREMDASLLLLPACGFVAVDDERMVRTVDEIRRVLQSGGLIRRYLPHRIDDGLGQGEGVFLACSFWMAECLAKQGRWEEAADQFEQAAATANDLGLFSEEFDPDKGLMLGNFPQGLSHLSHITAALALADTGLPPEAWIRPAQGRE
jgi:GH15 family glucan-1,4-alpha-glucosidase